MALPESITEAQQSLISANSPDNRLHRMLRTRPISFCAALFCLWLWLLPFATLQAQPDLPIIADRQEIPLPKEFSRVEFYLLTVDVGDHVWDNFGHTALRVVDQDSGTDITFNWGLFDSSIGLLRFGWNFMSGVMDYQLGVSPTEWELGRYQREERTVWQDRLVLEPEQKERLYQRLSWNLRDENIVYAYDYFFDNCTTRVRDYIDEALDGEVYGNSRINVPRTFRDEVQAHYASLPPIALSLDVLMNSRIDQRMTQWQQMFLPLSLRDQLQRMDLLDQPQVIMEFATPPTRFSGHRATGLLLIPVLLLFLMVRRVSISSFGSAPGYVLAAPGVSYRVLGAITLLVALCSGIWGLIMVFGWLFSAHADLHHNLNLLLFWPTDLLAIPVALRWLLVGKPVRTSPGRQSFYSFYLVLHILAALAYLIIGLLSMTDQALGGLMLYVLPPLLFLSVLVMTAGFRPVRAISFS